MSIAAALVAGVLGVGASPAFAADATLSGLTFDVVQDGSSSNQFDSDATVSGRSWNRNDVVAANDWIQYRATAQVAAPGVVTYTSTLPVGMRWDPAASAASVCDAGGTITNSSRTLTCKVTASSAGSQQVEFRAWAYENGDGEKLQPSLTANGVSVTASSAVTVAATVAMEFSTYRNTFARDTVGGQDGILWTQFVDFGATRPGGDLRGLEALTEPLEFELVLPAGAVIPTNLLPSGVTVTQTGGVATFTVTGITSFAPANITSSTLPANFTSARRLNIPIFVPYGPDLPSGKITTLQGQFSGFDPTGISGESNFGTGYAQGQAPGDALLATNPSRNGFSFSVDRSQSVKLVQGQTHVTNLNGQRMVGSVNQVFRASQYPVTPGQEFRTGMGVVNDTIATDAAHDVFGCVAFDAQLVNLIGAPRGQSGISAYAASDFLTGTPLQASDYVVEYASLNLADNSARRAYDCGVAGDGSTVWHSTIAAAGGSDKVDAVRVKYLPALDPSRAYGLSLPMKRTTTAASLAISDNKMIPWFWQFGSTEVPVIKSNMPDSPALAGNGRGGGIDAISAMVRHRAVWSTASVQGGQLATLTVTPRVIGAPVAGIDAVAKEVRIQIDLDSTCSIPVKSSLDAIGVPFDYTAPDFGADGLPCTADDGAPASITFRLGDINAPGGTPGGSFNAAVVGHETLLPSFSFQVEQSIMTPNGSTRTATSVISSPSDFTQASQGGASAGTDRTETPTLTVASVASFAGNKVAATDQPGVVAPGEEFQYTLNWANGTPQMIGVGRFVDVLPFNGDARGTTGLGAPLAVSKVSSQMTTPAMGTVGIEYTTDAAATVEAAVAQAGNEDGSSGVTWKPLSGDTPPAGVTALRFTTSKEMQPGYGGTASITVNVDDFSLGGHLVNDMNARTEPVAGDPTTVQHFRAVSSVDLRSSAAKLSGHVQRDLDFDGGFSAGDGSWPAGTGTIEIYSPAYGKVVATTDLDASGNYSVTVPAGEYEVRLKSAESAGWKRLLPGTPVMLAAEAIVTNHNVLYQEVIDDPALADDPGLFAPPVTVSQGKSVQVDATANDTLDMPTAPGSIGMGAESNTVALPATTTAKGGSISVTAPVIPGVQSTVTYTAPAVWPADVTGNSFTDSFDYTWTNVLGVTETATVTVTVLREASAVADAATILDAATGVDVLANDSGADLAVTAATVLSGDATVAFTAAGITVTPTHQWGTDETTHEVTVEYSIVDGQGATASANAVVTVVRAPVLSGENTETIDVDGATTVLRAVPLNPDVIAATGAYAITTPPSAGSASVADDGSVQFDAAGIAPGVYTFTVTVTDELGQKGSRDYTVTVQGPSEPGLTVDQDSDSVGSQKGTTVAEFPGVKITGENPVLTFTDVPKGAASDPVLKDGVITWDTAGLAPGEYTFTGVVRDDSGQEVKVTFTVTVYPALVAEDQEALVGTMPKTATHTFTEKVSGGDGTTKAAITEMPKRGSVKLGPVVYTSYEGGGVYAPKGVYTMVVTYTDGVGQTATATYTVTVQPAPVGEGEKTTLKQGSAGAVFDPIGNTTGTNLQSVTKASVVTSPGHGSVTMNGVMIRYMPEDGFVGTDQFTVSVCDDLGQCTELNYQVTVLAPGQSVAIDSSGAGSGLAVTGGNGAGTLVLIALAAVLGAGGVLLAAALRRRQRRSGEVIED